jgi:hypothetical protein
MRLPSQFADLQEFADRYAVSDDVARSARTSAADATDRRNFIDAVWLRLGAINDYLNHNDDESAHLLGRLAEAACEVAIEIGRPTGS